MRRAAPFLLTLCASMAFASDWHEVHKAEARSLHVDRQSIVQAGKYRKAWVMSSFASARTASTIPPVEYSSIKQLVFVSCKERTMASFQGSYYSEGFGGGSSVKSFQYKFNTDEFAEVVPDTWGEAQLQFICGYRGKEKKQEASQGNNTGSNSSGKPRLSPAELEARANGKGPRELSPAEVKKLGY